jgi:hypothetical protein
LSFSVEVGIEIEDEEHVKIYCSVPLSVDPVSVTAESGAGGEGSKGLKLSVY